MDENFYRGVAMVKNLLLALANYESELFFYLNFVQNLRKKYKSDDLSLWSLDELGKATAYRISLHAMERVLELDEVSKRLALDRCRAILGIVR